MGNIGYISLMNGRFIMYAYNICYVSFSFNSRQLVIKNSLQKLISILNVTLGISKILKIVRHIISKICFNIHLFNGAQQNGQNIVKMIELAFRSSKYQFRNKKNIYTTWFPAFMLS